MLTIGLEIPSFELDLYNCQIVYIVHNARLAFYSISLVSLMRLYNSLKYYEGYIQACLILVVLLF